MKTFKEFITESNNVFLSKEFVKNVENYIFKNDQKYAKYLAKYKKEIPDMFKFSGILYRGYVLTSEDIDKIKNGENLEESKISSWTSSEKMAERFIKDNKKSVKKAGGGIVFKKKINAKDVIINLQGYVMFLDTSGKLDEFEFDELNAEMAYEECEVLCDGKFKLTKKDIHRII